MKLYHHTTQATADTILESGFPDAQGGTVKGRACLGVRLLARPPRLRPGDALLVVDVPEIVASEYARVDEEGRCGYLVPAAVVNLTRVVRCHLTARGKEQRKRT